MESESGASCDDGPGASRTVQEIPLQLCGDRLTRSTSCQSNLNRCHEVHIIPDNPLPSIDHIAFRLVDSLPLSICVRS